MKIALSLLFLILVTKNGAVTNDAEEGHDIPCETNELPYACGSKGICRCNETRKGYSIDCSRRQLHNLSLVIPSNVTFANFSRNYLSLIAKDTFRLTTSLNMLNISRNNISELHEETFYDTTQLTALYISYNVLTKLPTTIFKKLIHLSLLDLSYNNLKSLPKGLFDNTTSLKLLYINDNFLTQLPKNIFQKPVHLSKLDLSYNNLMSLQKGLFDNTANLTSLSINDNFLTQLPTNIFQKLVHLPLLDLSYNNLTSLPKGLFDNITSLKLLYINDNFLTQLPTNIFQKLVHLSKLDLSFNNLTSLPKGLFDHTANLTSLYINDNLLTQLPTKIFQKLVHLSTLRLCYNNIKELSEDIFNGNSNLKKLDLSYNNLTSLPKGIFDYTTKLKFVSICNNQITHLPPDCFRQIEALNDLKLHENELTTLSKSMFAKNVSLIHLDLCDNNIARPTADFFPETKRLMLVSNNIAYIPEGMFQSLKNLSEIYLSKNKIETLSNTSLLGLNHVRHMDLSNNSLTVIPRGLFSAYGGNHGLLILQLQRNKLTCLWNDTFQGLGNLAYLILNRNLIHSIAEQAFLGTNLTCLYLVANNISNVSNNSFALENIDIHLYKNNILNFSQVALNGVGNGSTLYMNCNQLGRLPLSTNGNIICVNDETFPSLKLKKAFTFLVQSFEKQGFECQYIGKGRNECRPCPTGTLGGGFRKKCRGCPKGGFYQDEIGSIECKTCNDGNFVEKGSGSSLVQCKVCPEGTDKNVSAGYRACVCKENYARKHRFGECFLCIADGLNCSEDYISILPGFYWNWSFPKTKPDQYLKFVQNLETKTDDYDNTTMQYGYSMPFVYRCPRSRSCDNKDGLPMYGIDNCAAGYTGWMCSKCRSGYYSVLSSCHPCPSKLWVLVVFLFVVLSCVALLSFIVWKKNKISNQRTMIDKLSSRIKIVLGFYQVIGDLFETFHNVQWQGPLLIFGEFLSMVVADFFQVFVRPQCINEKFEINPLLQFKIVLIFPVVLVITYLYLSCTVYFIAKCGFFSLTVRQRAKQTVSKLFNLVVLVLFVTYTPTCNSIFAVYPAACSTFKIYSVGNESITLLRADYGIDCKDLDSYHVAAYIATAVYVVGFPLSLLILLRKYHTKGKKATTNADFDCSYGGSIDETTPLVTGTERRKYDSPVWFNFLCENYKSQFWYWEVIELTRKVTQTVMVTLLGWHNSLTQLSTIGMSVLFLTLHAKYSPMKNKFEQRLQFFFFGCDIYKYHDSVCTSELRIRCSNIYWSLCSRYFHHIYRLS
ncbi:uncharacterized protein [Apostichopus japonicus]|uniref:uncharacterized protein isoform X2 n=1 Tax=Stichopus japonicus TaxID=307972 RepID=UPI003AB8BF67